MTTWLHERILHKTPRHEEKKYVGTGHCPVAKIHEGHEEREIFILLKKGKKGIIIKS